MAHENVGGLRAWLATEGGVLHSALALTTGDDERGLVTHSDLEEGTVLVAVPSRHLLTAGAAKARGLPASLAEEDLVALLLLSEFSAASPRALWVAALPTRFDVPLMWQPETDQATLCCPSLGARAAAQRAEVAERFEGVLSALPDDHPLRADLTLARFQWAVACLESRGVHLTDPYLGAQQWAVVPVGDMLNHAPEAASNVVAGYDSDAGIYSFSTSRRVAAGEQLWLCYGPHDDATLLLSYGFVLGPRVNPHARVHAPAAAVGALAAAEDTDAEWLESNGLDEGEHALTPLGPSWSLLGALRLAHSSAGEREAGAAFSILEGGAVSAEGELRVWQAVLDLARTLRDTTWRAGADDERGGADPAISGAGHEARRRLGQQWAAAQRDVLTACIDATEKQLLELQAEPRVASGGGKRRR